MNPTGRRPLTIAVASGKGGTGKTFLSTNLFYVLVREGIPVTLADCDAEEPNDLVFFPGEAEHAFPVTQRVPVIDETRCTFCGRCHDWCSYNAIFLIPPAKMIRVMEDLCHSCGACTAACPEGAITEKEVSMGVISRFAVSDNARLVEGRTRAGVYSPVPVIKAAIREAGRNGIVILDAPPGTSCPFIHTAAAADFVVLVTEPTPFGLSDLKQSVETLKTIRRPCGVVLNRAMPGRRDVQDYLEQEGIPLLLEIPFSRDVAMHYSKGELVAAHVPEWHTTLRTLFSTLDNLHGNRHHQR